MARNGLQGADVVGPARLTNDAHAFVREVASAWVEAARIGAMRTPMPDHAGRVDVWRWRTQPQADVGAPLLARRPVEAPLGPVDVAAWGYLPPPSCPDRRSMAMTQDGVVLLSWDPLLVQRRGPVHARWRVSLTMAHEMAHVTDPRWARAPRWWDRTRVPWDRAIRVRRLVEHGGLQALVAAGMDADAWRVKRQAHADGTSAREAARDLCIRAYRACPQETSSFGAEALWTIRNVLEAARTLAPSQEDRWRQALAARLRDVADGRLRFFPLGLETLREDAPLAWRRLLRTAHSLVWSHPWTGTVPQEDAEHALLDPRASPFVPQDHEEEPL